MTEEERIIYKSEIAQAMLLGINISTCSTIGALREKIKEKQKQIQEELIEYINSYNTNRDKDYK